MGGAAKAPPGPLTDPFAHAADLLDPRPWAPPDRPPLLTHQVPPASRWKLWLLLAGRGAGKTEACARYYAQWMRAHPGHRGRIIAPTLGDAVEACVTGPSGLQSVDPDVRFLASAPGGMQVVWPNGSKALIVATPTPRDVDRLRAGGNRHLDWWEELAANPQLDAAWPQAQLGLRLGTRPHTVASTTPRTRPLLRTLLAAASTVVTRARMDDNPHLSAEWRAEMKALYAGTRLGLQELEGLLLDDVEGALWTLALIERARDAHPVPLPPLFRTVTAVDPSASATGDETGIVTVAHGMDHLLHVLGDASLRATPDGWGRAAVAAYHRHSSGLLLAEANQGGEMVRHVIASIDPTVRVHLVHAHRDKATRAAPVVALYEQGRITHAAGMPALEDQQTTWDPSGAKVKRVPGMPAPTGVTSPDRVDALVHAVAELAPALHAAAVQPTEPDDHHRPITDGAMTEAW